MCRLYQTRGIKSAGAILGALSGNLVYIVVGTLRNLSQDRDRRQDGAMWPD